MTETAPEEPKKIDRDSPERLAKILAMMGADAEGVRDNAAAQAAALLRRWPDLAQNIAATLSRMTGGKDQPSYEEIMRKLDEALDANAAYAAQNAAIRDAYEKACRPGLWKRLKDAFTPAARASGDTVPKKGFLRSAFAAAVPGVLAGAALMMDASLGAAAAIAGPIAVVAVIGGAGVSVGAGAAVAAGIAFITGVTVVTVVGSGADVAAAVAAAVGIVLGAAGAANIAGIAVTEDNLPLSPGKVFAGTLVGAALSAALMFSAATEFKKDEAPAASESAASALPAIGAQMPDGTVYFGHSVATDRHSIRRPLYTTPNKERSYKHWEQANADCFEMNDFGHDDWRLADMDELNILYRNKGEGKLKDTFMERGGASYWSSSLSDVLPGHAWQLEFSKGGLYNGDKVNNTGLVRCVRG